MSNACPRPVMQAGKPEQRQAAPLHPGPGGGTGARGPRTLPQPPEGLTHVLEGGDGPGSAPPARLRAALPRGGQAAGRARPGDYPPAAGCRLHLSRPRPASPPPGSPQPPACAWAAPSGSADTPGRRGRAAGRGRAAAAESLPAAASPPFPAAGEPGPSREGRPGLSIPPPPAGPRSRAARRGEASGAFPAGGRPGAAPLGAGCPPSLPAALALALGRALTRRRAGSRGWHPAAGWASPRGAPVPCLPHRAAPTLPCRRRRGRRTRGRLPSAAAAAALPPAGAVSGRTGTPRLVPPPSRRRTDASCRPGSPAAPAAALRRRGSPGGRAGAGGSLPPGEPRAAPTRPPREGKGG